MLLKIQELCDLEVNNITSSHFFPLFLLTLLLKAPFTLTFILSLVIKYFLSPRFPASVELVDEHRKTPSVMAANALPIRFTELLQVRLTGHCTSLDGPRARANRLFHTVDAYRN